MFVPPAVDATPPPAAVLTGNWAGYEWNGGTGAAGVSAAEFVVPNHPYAKMNGAERANHTSMAIWTGLYGYPSIAQIGIYDYAQNGQTDWAGFCAFWPQTDVSCGQGISTGDEIFVSVHRSGLTYTMSMKDAGPHNHWAVSIKKTLPEKLTTGVGVVEDTQYPGYPLVPLSGYSNIRMATSGNPTTEVYSKDAGFANRINSRAIWIKRG